MRIAELLQHINAIHHTTFALVEQYSDGEQGAFAITDHLSRQCVLKWRPGARNLRWMQEAKTVTDLLRSIGYPAHEHPHS